MYLADVQGGLRLSSVLSILVQAVAGLLHLHSLGILHGDLRAANVLLDSLSPLRAVVSCVGAHQPSPLWAVGAASPLRLAAAPDSPVGAKAVGATQVRPGGVASSVTGPMQVRCGCGFVWVWGGGGGGGGPCLRT